MSLQKQKIERTVALYNAVPNVAWSIVHLVPVSVFCYKWLDLPLLYSFLAVSLLTVLLPRSFFKAIEAGRTVTVYKKLGVTFINKFTQNGQIINGLIRKRFPQYKVVNSQKRSLNKLFQQTYVFEKFHFMLFIFFVCTTAYALIIKQVMWAIVLLFSNILYNVYPCLLQQYIRIRLAASIKKGMSTVERKG